MKTRIVLLGPPASGKGTQADMIRAKYKIATPSVGAILREQSAAGTQLGLEAEKYTREGRLAPDEMIVALVETWLSSHDGAFVFDGFPRTTGQVGAIDRMLNERNTSLEIALSLDVDHETIRDRVSRRMVCSRCGFTASVGWHVESIDSNCPRCNHALHRRKDDTLDALEHRMTEYSEKTEPLMSFYQRRGILKNIDGRARPEVVFAEVCAALEN